MSKVFVLDPNQQPLNPVHPGRARLLLRQGKAAVWRRYPFTIVLKAQVKHPQVDPLRIKIDPGSKTTGLAIVNDASGEVVFAAELTHRGTQIRDRLEKRRAVRRARRQRKTRYRKPRFDNRRRAAGWLPPSLASCLQNVLTWVERLRRLCCITAISQELVKFDTQQMQNPEISGVEYQQGTLAGYEVRAYLLEKWGRKCAYCGVTGVPLEVEHMHPRSRSHDNRVCNLTLACHPCNEKKGHRDLREFLTDQPDLLKQLLAMAKAPLKDVAAVNASRWALYHRLKALRLPVECGSGGLTKFNRMQRGLPKTHWLDAACVGTSTPAALVLAGVAPVLIAATGHGSRQKCNVTTMGFPCSKPKGARSVKGFQTGDLVRAIVPTGKKQGRYVGRVLVRASGSFDIRTKQGRVQGISHRFCTLIQQADGYTYAPRERSA